MHNTDKDLASLLIDRAKYRIESFFTDIAISASIIYACLTIHLYVHPCTNFVGVALATSYPQTLLHILLKDFSFVITPFPFRLFT